MDQSSSWEIVKNLTETELLLDLASDINCTGSDFAASSIFHELREIKYRDGQFAMHGLRSSDKQSVPKYTWEKRSGSGMLESIVNQATEVSPVKSPSPNELFNWFSPLQDTVNFDSVDVTVPSSPGISTFGIGTSKNASLDYIEKYEVKDNEVKTQSLVPSSPGISTFGIGTSKTASFDYIEKNEVKDNEVKTQSPLSQSQRLSFSETIGSRYIEDDSSRKEVGVTSTSRGVDSNTSRKQARTRDKSVQNEKSSISTKRSKAAAIHNQSERKRRDKINKKMNALQELVPNSNKTDKASMLDEVIEYVKSLKMQINIMSGASMAPAMMVPISIQQFQMSMMAQMRMHGLGMSMGAMDMNSMGHPNMAGIPPVMNPATFMHMPPWNVSNEYLASSTSGMVPDPRAALIACQTQQQMTMDAYSRMVPLYQQQQPPLQQQQQQIPTTKS